MHAAEGLLVLPAGRGHWRRCRCAAFCDVVPRDASHGVSPPFVKLPSKVLTNTASFADERLRRNSAAYSPCHVGGTPGDLERLANALVFVCGGSCRTEATLQAAFTFSHLMGLAVQLTGIRCGCFTGPSSGELALLWAHHVHSLEQAFRSAPAQHSGGGESSVQG